MNPQISEEEVLAFYPDNYAPHGADVKTLKNERKQKTSLPDDILKKIDNRSTVLDIGCGSGKFLFNVKNRTGCRVEGVDISANAVKQSKVAYGLNIFQGNIFDAPFPKNHFDLITAFSYIEHVPEPSSVIKKISELLKSGGLFLIKNPQHR